MFRELKMSAGYELRMRGAQKRQPDFVVVGPELGVMAIETKDWNLTTNTYTWLDQRKIRKTRLSDGSSEEIDNPAAQADDYLYALMELLHNIQVYVASIVAFPKLARAEFLSRLETLAVLQNPQSRFLLAQVLRNQGANR